MESKPPAVWLGRKDMSIILEFCKHFYTSRKGEKDVSCSERINLTLAVDKWGWEKVVGQAEQNCKEEVSAPVDQP